MEDGDEDTPLLGPMNGPRPRPRRNVTFDDNPVTRTIGPVPVHTPSQRIGGRRASGSHSVYGSYPATGGHSSGIPPPVLTALNNRLRRRNSQGSMPTFLPPPTKIGPQRSSKTAQKLKLLPEPDKGEEDEDEESGRDVYSQFTRIKDPNARRDAARLGKADRERLPRVTAYCTANTYSLELLMRFLKGRGRRRGANPKLIDECIYTPYSYAKEDEAREDSGLGLGLGPIPDQGAPEGPARQQYDRRRSADAGDIALAVDSSTADTALGTSAFTEDEVPRQTPDEALAAEAAAEAEAEAVEAAAADTLDFDTQVHTPEIFLFEYGVVVTWGMSIAEEHRLLKEISKFEVERLPADQIETEEFNFYYTREYQPRIYNDFITLRDKHNYMTKLAISHALAQSVKTSLFEELIATTIETCKEIPNQISLSGKVALSRTEINMQIGELFTLRINIHLNGSVLDTPEIFWVEPHLEPVYQAVRSYLEMDQRVGLLTDRLDVIADLLAVMKDLLSHGHGEKLEWIIIILIAAEIFVALVNIVVDLYVGI